MNLKYFRGTGYTGIVTCPTMLRPTSNGVVFRLISEVAVDPISRSFNTGNNSFG